MTTEHRLGCDYCDFTVMTVGPQRVADGRLLARCYCAACGMVRECVVGVQAAPRTPFGVPLGPRHGQASRLARGLAGRLRDDAEMAANCPVCGNETFLMPQTGQELPCPRCGTGRLKERGAR